MERGACPTGATGKERRKGMRRETERRRETRYFCCLPRARSAARAIRVKSERRYLAGDSGDKSWEQYRYVNDGAEAPQGTERWRERGGIVDFLIQN